MKAVDGMAVASLVAAMFATGCGAPVSSKTDSTSQAIVKCSGINSCAGTSACAGSYADGGTHDCAGKNSCKGQGWIEVPKEECDTKGGTTIK